MKHQVFKNLLGQPSVKYVCPGCQTKLRSLLSEAGQADHCPECNASFVVPGKEQRQKFEQQQEQSKAAAEKAKAMKLAAKDKLRELKASEKVAVDQALTPNVIAATATAPRKSQPPPPVSADNGYPATKPRSVPPPLHTAKLVATAPAPTRPTMLCPYCHGELNYGVQKCRHCGEFLVTTGHSDALAGCLGLALGPVGLWYKGHFAAGFAWLAFTFLFFIFTGGFGLLLAPVFWIAMAVHAAIVPGKR